MVKFFAVWNNGKLYAEFEDGQRKELMYIHICKRKIECSEKKHIKDSEKMYIVPGRIIIDNRNQIKKDELFKYKS